MKSIKQYLPLIFVGLAFIWSAVVIATRRAEEAPKDAIVIRIGHWQLEAAVRDAINELAVDFANHPLIKEKYPGKRIVVLQDGIPESVYGQWITSQMMGETAPDLVEVGLGLPPPIWLAYQNRYFETLTTMANEPNPFNKGTPLEGVPLRETFTDDMRNGYVEEMQEFTKVPLSRFTIRLFYNRTLLQQLTGLSEPPRDYRGFVQLCEKIASQKMPGGDHYSPIASSRYHMPMWESGLFNILTYTNLGLADFNRDGTVGNDEFFAAFKSGTMSFESPANDARFRMTSEIKQFFQTGYTGLTRDDAVFVFAQQRGVFMPTGTWDAQSLVEQAKGKFEVGIMDFPLPTPDDPEYGSLALGPKYDQAETGFPFGLTRFSKNPEVAKDFLLFLASMEANRKLNHRVGWIPSVKGVPLPEMLKDFAPQDQGMYANFSVNLGGETWIKWQQDYSKYQTDPNYTYPKLFEDFGKTYRERGLDDWKEQQRDWRRAILKNERFLSGIRGEAILAASKDPTDPRWIKYRAYTMSRQVTPEINRAVQVQRVTTGPQRPGAPYEFLPEARERILASFRNSAPTPSQK